MLLGSKCVFTTSLSDSFSPIGVSSDGTFGISNMKSWRSDKTLLNSFSFSSIDVLIFSSFISKLDVDNPSFFKRPYSFVRMFFSCWSSSVSVCVFFLVLSIFLNFFVSNKYPRLPKTSLKWSGFSLIKFRSSIIRF